VAEAGFFPGVILYLTYWFPSRRRAHAIALFILAIPLASAIGAPLSGWIMEAFAGVQGLRGWQWLFALEAIPSLILGVTILLYLDDSIAGAKWLSPEEKALLQRNIAAENDGKVAHQTVRDFLADKRLWLLTGIYFCIVMGQYGLTFWLPTIVRNAGVSGMGEVGLLAAIPYMVALVCLPLVGRNSDRTRARRLHCGVPMLAAAAALFALPFTDGVGMALALLSVAAAGAICRTSQFWAQPTAFLGGMAAAAGIATINCIANLAGFFSPSLVGWLNDFTGKQGAGLMLTSAMLLIGACLVTLLPKQVVDR
jgi:MFS family permease